jgi:hypothetical protein
VLWVTAGWGMENYLGFLAAHLGELSSGSVG